MVYMLTAPTCTSSIAQLRVRVCGVGSRRERVGVRVRVRVRSGVTQQQHLIPPQDDSTTTHTTCMIPYGTAATLFTALFTAHAPP